MKKNLTYEDIKYIDWYPEVNQEFNKRQNLQSGVTIGLFGTCGGSKWRDPFMKKYSELGMHCYNPQVANWTPDCATEEARHLAEDKIILFPVTSETYASGSLCEVGFSILNAIRLDHQRYFVIMISKDLDENLKGSELAYKDSIKSRALVREHLRKLMLDNLYVVDSLEQMLEVSITLYEAARITEPFASYNPHRQPRLPLKLEG